MRIGIIYLSNLGNSWNMSEGVINAARRMGHEVTTALHIHGDIPHSEKPTPEWNGFDFVLVLEAEYVPPEYWVNLTCPKALWFTESSKREDLTWFGELYQNLTMQPGARGFFVAKQDSDEYGGTWLPHGVDTEMFRPLGIPKVHDIGLFGQIYPRRVKTWQMIQESGIDVHRIERKVTERREMNELLVCDINECNMILGLPAYSHSFTTRSLETMACGVPFVVPYMADFARCNEAQFSYPPAYYYENNIASLRAAIEQAWAQDRQDIITEVVTRHRLELRIEQIIDVMGRQ